MVVTHVSNYRPVKRIPALVEVFARIRRSVPSTLVLVGDGPDLPHGLALARDLGVAGDVRAVGEQGDVRSLLSASDVFLLPSATESFGLAALEAMACEVPVIASRVGGLPEVIESGVNGYLHEPDDLDGMAASAVALLTDRDLRRRIGTAGRNVVHRRYCSDRIVPSTNGSTRRSSTSPRPGTRSPGDRPPRPNSCRVKTRSGCILLSHARPTDPSFRQLPPPARLRRASAWWPPGPFLSRAVLTSSAPRSAPPSTSCASTSTRGTAGRPGRRPARRGFRGPGRRGRSDHLSDL